MPKQAKRVSAYYFRDDGQLMIEVQPGQFVSETAARLGLFHPNLLADIQRIKGRLQRPAGKIDRKERLWVGYRTSAGSPPAFPGPSGARTRTGIACLSGCARIDARQKATGLCGPSLVLSLENLFHDLG